MMWIFKGPMSQIARKVAQDLQEKIAFLPALRIIADRGWNPEYDEKPR